MCTKNTNKVVIWTRERRENKKGEMELNLCSVCTMGLGATMGATMGPMMGPMMATATCPCVHRSSCSTFTTLAPPVCPALFFTDRWSTKLINLSTPLSYSRPSHGIESAAQSRPWERARSNLRCVFWVYLEVAAHQRWSVSRNHRAVEVGVKVNGSSARCASL